MLRPGHDRRTADARARRRSALAAAAGSVLFVIESGKTRTRAAIEALNRLEVTGTHILGAVLTKSSDGGGYGYGRYGYGYGYGYGPKGRIKKNEILMIPHEEEAGRVVADTDA